MKKKKISAARAVTLAALCGTGLSLLFLVPACTENKAAVTSVDKFQVISPALTDTCVTSEYVADIHSLKNVELRARVKGYLDKILVDEGQAVKKGQVLFSISKQDFAEELTRTNADLKSALADAKAAELDVQNEQMLVDKKVVSSAELDMAKARLEAARARTDVARSNVASANLNLSYTEIKAPFDGVIDRIPNKTGSLIDEGMLLTTISDNKAVFAYFNVSEEEYLQFSKDDKGRDVQLVLADNSLYPYPGKVETVESEVDKGTGNIAFRARFENPGNILKNGSGGKVILKKSVSQVLLIPQKCAMDVQDKQYVYVLDAGNKVHMKPILPLYRIPNYYVLATGLSPQDRVLYEGLQVVKDGDEISADHLSFSQVASNLARM